MNQTYLATVEILRIKKGKPTVIKVDGATYIMQAPSVNYKGAKKNGNANETSS